MTEVVPAATQTQAVPVRKGPCGEVKIYATWCKGCHICVEFCPTNVLALYENLDSVNVKIDGTPGETTGIRISDFSFHCEGDVCNLTCQPFKIASQHTYEFICTLRVSEAGLVLENIDLEQSRQLDGDGWLPIPSGSTGVVFP